jgi:hypothetical protein
MHPPNPFEESVCQFEQAILWAVYRDAAKTQRKRSLFALRKWPPKVLDGLWRLLRVLEEEAIGSRRYAIERPNGDWWRQVRQHLKQYEAAFGGARPFIAEVARAVAGVTIITADLAEAFSSMKAIAAPAPIVEPRQAPREVEQTCSVTPRDSETVGTVEAAPSAEVETTSALVLSNGGMTGTVEDAPSTPEPEPDPTSIVEERLKQLARKLRPTLPETMALWFFNKYGAKWPGYSHGQLQAEFYAAHEKLPQPAVPSGTPSTSVKDALGILEWSRRRQPNAPTDKLGRDQTS